MQRDGAADRMVWPEPLLAVLNPKLLVEQSPPDHHYLAGKFDIDLIGDPRHREPAVNADGAALGLASKGAEPLPGAHLAHPIRRQVPQPVVDPAMRLGAVIAKIG